MNGRAAALAVLGVLSGCVYYNAMWSAERFARQARRAESSGQIAEARGLWSRAAGKAETVVVRHPRSRWTDDAMVLAAEALVRSGSCQRAAAALARADSLLLETELRERVDLAVAECAIAAGRAERASALLTPIVESRDAGRRGRAAYLAGRAARARGDPTAAAALLARSTHPAAGAERARVLLASGRSNEALALLDTLAARPFTEASWSELLDTTAAAAGPPAASGALDRLLARGRVPRDAAVRLLTADGDRRAAASEWPVAAGRYAAAVAIAPDAQAADAAQVRRLRALAVEAASLDDLAPLRDALSRARGADAGLNATLVQITERETDVAAFRGAELARDSLHAPRLAAQLFIDVARRWPESVFAAKALVAALAVAPDRQDSLAAVLDERYASSPYTLALRGEAAPALAAFEDSLARALGVAVATAPRAAAFRVASPVPGPRSVWFEPPVLSAPAGRPVTDTPTGRPPSRRPGQRPEPQRPVERP
jgi:predicted negative regulator of RcsB-dependent stress response